MGAGDFLNNAMGSAQKDAQSGLKNASNAIASGEKTAPQDAQQLESKVQQTVQQANNDDQALQNQAQQAIQSVQQPAAKSLTQQVTDTMKGGAAKAAATAVATFAKLQQTFSSPDPVDATSASCQNKSSYSLAMSVQQSQQLVQQAQEQGLGNTPQVQVLQQSANASQMALMADDVYAVGANKPPVNVPGFQRVSDEGLKNMGLSPAMFANAEQNFRAQLYAANSLTGQAQQYVLAFRGTVQDSAANWNDNFRNALGLESEGYNQAIALAARVQRAAQLQGAALQTTGHSLGGGLAQAASSYLSSVGAPISGTIFNAAGYNPASTPQFPSQSTVDSLTNYHVAGEAVTTLQNKLGLTPASAKQVQLPGVPNAGSVALHSMDSVEKGLLSENKQAQSAVSGLLGKP